MIAQPWNLLKARILSLVFLPFRVFGYLLSQSSCDPSQVVNPIFKAICESPVIHQGLSPCLSRGSKGTNILTRYWWERRHPLSVFDYQGLKWLFSFPDSLHSQPSHSRLPNLPKPGFYNMSIMPVFCSQPTWINFISPKATIIWEGFTCTPIWALSLRKVLQGRKIANTVSRCDILCHVVTLCVMLWHSGLCNILRLPWVAPWVCHNCQPLTLFSVRANQLGI